MRVKWGYKFVSFTYFFGVAKKCRNAFNKRQNGTFCASVECFHCTQIGNRWEGMIQTFFSRPQRKSWLLQRKNFFCWWKLFTRIVSLSWKLFDTFPKMGRHINKRNISNEKKTVKKSYIFPENCVTKMHRKVLWILHDLLIKHLDVYTYNK